MTDNYLGLHSRLALILMMSLFLLLMGYMGLQLYRAYFGRDWA